MKADAMVLVRKGDAENAFERRSIQLSEPGKNEVFIDTEAFGLNYADVMARRGLYREAPPFPCVIGYEVVGKISAIGENVSKDLLGKRVVAFCRFGGYAKKVLTNDYAVVEIGETPAEEAMVLCTQAVTAYYMSMYLTPLHAGDKVLIHAAAGGVGTILIQLAKMKGAEVFAKIGSASKEELVRSLGADYVIDYSRSDYAAQIQQILGKDRIDISFNPVAGSTFKKDMALLGSGGRMVLFGGSELSGGKFGILSQLNFVFKMGLILPIGLMMRSKNILGVNMLKIADNKPYIMEVCLKEVMALYHAGKIRPQVGGTYTVTELAKAHAFLESGKSTGKLSVFWD